MADGDGRAALTLAEEVWRAARPGRELRCRGAETVVQRRAPIYDKKQDGHYNLISALHKSVRGSDADAALYYLCRMLDAGEDPLYLARRIVRMAVEDIGLADPQALVVANAAKEAYDFLGSPEGELAIAEAVIYVATAPKSNATYVAFGEAMRTAKEAGSLLPPKHILNAPTKLMKTEGYGSGYQYDHDTRGGVFRPGLFPRAIGAAAVLRSARTRLRARDQKAAGILGEAASRAGQHVRSSRGPRQPGGGRQKAGPRHRQQSASGRRFARRHPRRRTAAKRRPQALGAPRARHAGGKAAIRTAGSTSAELGTAAR